MFSGIKREVKENSHLHLQNKVVSIVACVQPWKNAKA